MASRRHIREAVVQFLYGAGMDDTAHAADIREAFWLCVTEKERRTYQVAVFRTLAHLAQGRGTRAAEFLERAAPALAKLGGYPEAGALRDDLGKLVELEGKWARAFDDLNRKPTDDPDKAAVARRFESGLAGIFTLCRELGFVRRRFLEGLADFPILNGPMEPVAASIRRLAKFDERLLMAENPAEHPGQADFGKLRELQDGLSGLRQRGDDLINAVRAHLPELDDAIGAVVDNYSPERIDPVDRAILRLAAYELAHAATPPKVVLNEAIEMARRFGTSDSHRFVNGVLDPLAKRLRG